MLCHNPVQSSTILTQIPTFWRTKECNLNLFQLAIKRSTNIQQTGNYLMEKYSFSCCGLFVWRFFTAFSRAFVTHMEQKTVFLEFRRIVGRNNEGSVKKAKNFWVAANVLIHFYCRWETIYFLQLKLHLLFLCNSVISFYYHIRNLPLEFFPWNDWEISLL